LMGIAKSLAALALGGDTTAPSIGWPRLSIFWPEIASFRARRRPC
jgi:hypothetical protein